MFSFQFEISDIRVIICHGQRKKTDRNIANCLLTKPVEFRHLRNLFEVNPNNKSFKRIMSFNKI